MYLSLLVSNVVIFLVLSQGNIIDLPKDEDTPEKRVDKIFKQMDKVSEETVALVFKNI